MNINLAKFPDLGKEAKLLKISVDLEGAKADHWLGDYIRKSLRLHSIRNTIKYIRQFCKTAPEMRELMEWVIGAPLLKEIETIEI